MSDKHEALLPEQIRALVEAARSGDDEARASLCRYVVASIRRVFAPTVDCGADLDDVLQETVLRVLESLDQVGDPESIVGYSVRIGRHVVTDEHRDRAARVRASAAALEANPPSNLTSECELVARYEELLARVRDSLDDGEFRHFELAVVDALPHKRIAERLGMTVEASRVWKRRILDKLRAALGLPRDENQGAS